MFNFIPKLSTLYIVCLLCPRSIPPRKLQVATLQFTPQEHAFYDNILERTRNARNKWSEHSLEQQQQQLAQQPATGDDATAATEIASGSAPPPMSSSAAPPSASALSPAVRARGRGRGRGGAAGSKDKGLELARLAKTALLQLRIACIHPQV